MEAKPLQIVPSSHNTSGFSSTLSTFTHYIISFLHFHFIFIFLLFLMFLYCGYDFVFFFLWGVGGGPHKKIDMGHKSEGGVVDEEKSVVVVEKSSSIVEHKCCVFTEVQRCELDHQVSIFNHFAYNLHLPLPHYLLQFSTNMSGL